MKDKILLKEEYSNKASLTVTFFLAIEIMSFFFLNKSFFDIVFVLMGLLIFLKQIKFILGEKIKLFSFFLFISIFSFLIMFLFQNRLTTIPLRVMMHFALFILLIRYKINSKYIKYLLYGFIAFTFYKVFILGTRYGDVLASGSENFIGWIVLSLGVYYYLLRYINREKLTLQVALVVLITAIIYIGRGTIVGALILLAAIVYHIVSNKSIIIKLLSFFSLILLFLVFMSSNSVFESFEVVFRKFAEKGIELDGRDFILQSYIEKLNLQTFFTGVSPNQAPFNLFNNNLHNSYLLVHSQFGFVGALFIAFVILTFLFKIWKKPFLCLLFLSISVRVFTDSIAYLGYIDFFIFYHFYLIWNKQFLNNQLQIIVS
ncbi:MAG: hypothetical protein ACTJGD_11875 [Mesonia hippocampi]|uniref:hypothetical protein n=1 Tax=Mesonia hippocampi TaxID=1628250 RepID=UPI003F98D83D